MRFPSSRASLIIAIASVVLVCSPAAALAAGDDPFADFDAHASQALDDWKVPAVAISVVKDGRVVFGAAMACASSAETLASMPTPSFRSPRSQRHSTPRRSPCWWTKGGCNGPTRSSNTFRNSSFNDPWMTREVTLIDCLAHRTGLADPDLLSYSGVTRAELLSRMRFLPQIEPFRTASRYNNKAIIVAGEVIERVSGQSWSDFVRKRVLQPLDMTASVPNVLELTGVENVATPYVDVDGHLEEDKTWALPLSDGWRTYRETIRPAGRSARPRTTWRSLRSSSWVRANSTAGDS